VLTELSVKNFRGIRDGLFTELGRVNIIVGPNNCGKSSSRSDKTSSSVIL
jgi:AAA15 family ATPase/GTPase